MLYFKYDRTMQLILRVGMMTLEAASFGGSWDLTVIAGALVRLEVIIRISLEVMHGVLRCLSSVMGG